MVSVQNQNKLQVSSEATIYSLDSSEHLFHALTFNFNCQLQAYESKLREMERTTEELRRNLQQSELS